MKNYVEYKGGLIARNSEAFALLEAGNRKALDNHLAAVAKAARELPERYARLELGTSLEEDDILEMIRQRAFEVGGFASLYGSKIEHFFRNGQSLCGHFQITNSAGLALKKESHCPCSLCIKEAP